MVTFMSDFLFVSKSECDIVAFDFDHMRGPQLKFIRRVFGGYTKSTPIFNVATSSLYMERKSMNNDINAIAMHFTINLKHFKSLVEMDVFFSFHSKSVQKLIH